MIILPQNFHKRKVKIEKTEKGQGIFNLGRGIFKNTTSPTTTRCRCRPRYCCSFPSPRHDIGGVRKALDQFFGGEYVDKPHRGPDHQTGPDFSFPDQLIQPDQRSGGVADGEDQVFFQGAAFSILTAARVIPRSFASRATSVSAMKQ